MNTPEVETLAAARDVQSLAAWARQSPPADVADVLEHLPEDERVALFGRLADARRTEVFTHLECDTQFSLMRALEEGSARALFGQLEADDRTRFFERLPEEERERALGLLGTEARRETERLLRYAPESVGRLMSPNVAAVPERWRIADALAHVRTLRFGAEAIGTIYVTDDRGRLIDALELPRFVLADPHASVRDIMDGIYVCIAPQKDREEAVRLMQKHDLIALPVAEADGTLVGTVTVDDVLDVAREEATEDIQMQAGITPLRAAYPDVAAWSLFRKRLPWLAALIFVYLGASGVISAFEGALSAELVLAAFIPLLMGSGGNVGAQSGTLVVRALAMGDLEGRRWVTALGKELGVGVVLGLALAVLAGAVAHFRGGADIALVVGASMLLIVVAANLTGTLLPVLLERVGVDPAVAGSPVITSVTDLTSLVIYLGIATHLLAL